jgi:light-regulated signal transduction histidine kinase (bacteriophytochrome)
MTDPDPVTLSNCDREPIHIPGAIQRHGAMLVCDPRDYTLLFASENAAAVVGHAGPLRRGQSMVEIVGEQAAHELRNAASKGGTPELGGVVLGLTFPNVTGAFDATIHTHDGRAFIEFERCLDGGRNAQQALDLTQTLIRRISLESTVGGIAQAGARLLRAMLGYDRVMVYRFLHNGAGRVIAESRALSLGSFLGQHFPASDIPQQARRLYLVNPLRMIGDAAYAPIPLEPPLAPGEAPVDMSFAHLRSVSPIHCEYLRNMGVGASLSISIIVDGDLWGLISCHHNSPKVTPMALRVGAELFGQYFSLQIAAAERRAEMVAAAEARGRLDAIMADISADDAALSRLGDRLADFAALSCCDGAGLWVDRGWRAYGDALSQEAVVSLEPALADAPRGSIWTTQELRSATSSELGPVAGALAIPLSSIARDYLFLFRNEESHQVAWAGEPVKQVVTTPAGERLTPRGSFETWREEVKGRSRPWSASDISVAEAVRTYLRDVVLRQREASAEERALLEQRRRILNDELNHRVKNIISLVKSIALQTGAGATTVEDYAAALEGRLKALAFAHDQALTGAGDGDLATLVEAEASLHRYGASSDRVVASGEAIRVDDRTFGVLALVVHEMMTNAAKYGALSTAEGRLELSWRLTDAGDCELLWIERDGPPVTPPTRDGFGARLIRSTLEYDLRGRAEVAYEPDGVRARFLVPAAHVRIGAPAEPPATPAPPTPPGSLDGLGVLVVEDQGLIALDTEETLRRLGATDVRLSPTVADAEARLRGFEPDVAVLDFNLGIGTSEAVAEALEARRVPFVFATGYADSVMIPARFRNVPVVRKPVNAAALAANLDLARRQAAKATEG